MNPDHKQINPRTSRTSAPTDKQYILKPGSPKHYVSGFGAVGAGDIVTLPADAEPSQWMSEINPKDAAKVLNDEDAAAVLAEKAAARDAKK